MIIFKCERNKDWRLESCYNADSYKAHFPPRGQTTRMSTLPVSIIKLYNPELYSMSIHKI